MTFYLLFGAACLAFAAVTAGARDGATTMVALALASLSFAMVVFS